MRKKKSILKKLTHEFKYLSTNIFTNQINAQKCNFIFLKKNHLQKITLN